MRDDLNFQGITSVWFDEGESRYLANLPERAQADRFFTLWTRREACAKAMGISVDHDLDPSLMSQVLGHDGGDGSPQLTVRDLSIGSDYAAALCAAGTGWGTTWHDFPVDLHRSTPRRKRSSAT